MKDVDSLIENYFKPEKRKSSTALLKLIEEVVEEENNTITEKKEANFSAVSFYKTALKSFKPPTEQAGKLGTDERLNFQKYIANNIKGENLAAKIQSINAIVEGGPEGEPKISEIMASLGAVKMLQQMLDDFNESTAGFLFEAFLSGLLRGTQVTERVGGTLPIEDVMFFVDPKTGASGQPVSLKLLGPKTKIEGSLENLLGFFMRPEIAAEAEARGIEYIVATKTKKNELDMYSFNIKPSNFFYWIDERFFKIADYKEKEQLQEAIKSISPEAIDANKQQWENQFLKYRAPMFGLDSSEVEFKYDHWKNASYYWNVVKAPSVAKGMHAIKTAEVMLSPAGKKAFANWAKSDVGSDIAQFVVPPELEEAYRAGDTYKAVEIAKLGRKRLSSYMKSILGGGERFRESAIHIQRWWAANVKGEVAYGDIAKKINALVKAGDAQSIIQWAKVLTGLMKKGEKQFVINPIRVRSEGTLYGTIDINKRKIYRTLQKYSAQLERLVAPIYQEMDNLTSQINGYYLQNRVKDAFKASDTAKRLVDHTSQLSEEAKE
jgi:hypothetical protein